MVRTFGIEKGVILNSLADESFVDKISLDTHRQLDCESLPVTDFDIGEATGASPKGG